MLSLAPAVCLMFRFRSAQTLKPRGDWVRNSQPLKMGLFCPYTDIFLEGQRTSLLKKQNPKHAWLECHGGNRSNWSNKCARRSPLRGTTHVPTMPPCCCAAWKAIGTEPLSWNTIVCFWGVCVLSVGAGLSLCAALFTCWNITLIPERTPWGPFGPKQWRQAVFNTPHSALLSFFHYL